MGTQDVLQTIADRLHSTATVKSVFGEPIQAEGKVVVPIARVAYGFGGGFGSGPTGGDQDRNLGQGGGGGGGVLAKPVGVLEISAAGTRFIPLHNIGWMAAAMGVGTLIGVLLGRRRIRGS